MPYQVAIESIWASQHISTVCVPGVSPKTKNPDEPRRCGYIFLILLGYLVPRARIELATP
jgi:hypothetical protein